MIIALQNFVVFCQISTWISHRYIYISPLFWGFPGGSEDKAFACKAGDLDLPWVGKIPWRRKWQPTPVFLPGESHGQRSLAGYSPRGHKESDTTERLHTHIYLFVGCARFCCGEQASLVVACRLSCLVACGILVPRAGIELMSPALEGIFLTTEPPGKSQCLTLMAHEVTIPCI